MTSATARSLFPIALLDSAWQLHQAATLHELPRRVNAVLDQAAGQIARQKAAIPAVSPWP